MVAIKRLVNESAFHPVTINAYSLSNPLSVLKRNEFYHTYITLQLIVFSTCDTLEQSITSKSYN